MGAIEELSSSSGVVSMMKAEEVDSTMDHSSYVAVSESETEDPIEVCPICEISSMIEIRKITTYSSHQVF